MLVEFLLKGEGSWQQVLGNLAAEAAIASILGIYGGRAIVLALNRLGLAQGLHAPFVATSALVIFGLASFVHASGFLAVYLAGLVVGNRPTPAHNTVVVFLDAVTWLAQIVMFVLLGLLAWPERLTEHALPALAVALTLMIFARPAAVFFCLLPFRFSWREKLFISWVGLRGAVGIFLASIPLMVGLPQAQLFLMSASWWCWSRSWCKAGPSPTRRGGSISRCRATMRCRAGSSSTCPDSWRRRSSAIHSVSTVPICGEASFHHGRGRPWWCATSAS